MADRVSILNDLLVVRASSPIRPKTYSLSDINDFLKDAYQIVQLIHIPTGDVDAYSVPRIRASKSF